MADAAGAAAGAEEFGMPAEGSWEIRGGWVVRRLVEDLEITLIQAAGIVGNLGYESVGFTKLHEVGQAAGLGGYGWGQWTGDRRNDFLNWSADHKLDWRSDEANYGFLLFELKGKQQRALRELKKMGTLEAAVFSFGQTFERPGGTTPSWLPGLAGREAFGRRALLGAGGDVTLPDPIEGKVRELQGLLGVGVDGDPGPDTLGALSKWRKERG